MSAAYRALHINTSRERMEYSDFPMPATYPDFPHHTQIAAYFDDYVDHFGFRDNDPLRDGVEHARAAPTASGTLDARRRVDRALRRAARRQRPPLGPALARAAPSPARTRSKSEQIHAHDYKPEDQLDGKHVVVLGMGNSAMDIAVEASYHGAERTTSPPAAARGSPQVRLRRRPRRPALRPTRGSRSRSAQKALRG